MAHGLDLKLGLGLVHLGGGVFDDRRGRANIRAGLRHLGIALDGEHEGLLIHHLTW
jgi:hypothetical protein